MTFVVSNAIQLTVSDRGSRKSSWKGLFLTLVVIRSFKHHANDSSIWLGYTPSLRENALRSNQRPPTSLFLPPTSRVDLWLDRYKEHFLAFQEPYIYKHPCLLWDFSSPDPRFSSQCQ
ncbi:hypothetical protein TNCV_4221021 [Trichonephila clavipes]|nr:hypothetical protein TNCV_4221021 [Trichonephila clavipes]